MQGLLTLLQLERGLAGENICRQSRPCVTALGALFQPASPMQAQNDVSARRVSLAHVMLTRARRGKPLWALAPVPVGAACSSTFDCCRPDANLLIASFVRMTRAAAVALSRVVHRQMHRLVRCAITYMVSRTESSMVVQGCINLMSKRSVWCTVLGSSQSTLYWPWCIQWHQWWT